jgi:PKD repeat protein
MRHSGFCKNSLWPALLLSVLLSILIVPALGAPTTELTITKYANDGTTVLNQTTKTYQWLEANLPIKGDGATHYYHQGPTFNDTDPYDPAEWQNVATRDFGAVKGTDLKDLCELVGGAHPGDNIRLRAVDGMTLTYPYEYVYTPNPRQGQMVICWYNGEESKGGYEMQGTGYPPSYFMGMRLIMFADAKVNTYGWNTSGWHVFGDNDMREVWAPQYRYNFSGIWPSSGGISMKNVRYVNILSQDSAVIPIEGYSSPPSDPDGDGLFEDLNANGRKDFQDVVVFFNKMEWIEANEPISSFDFNGNTRIDFNDIVRLFGEL